MREQKWYKLDNIGKFYASTENDEVPNVFRFSVSLKNDIDEIILNLALKETLIIIPSFNVNLKKGIFWYYLEETNKQNKVTKENLPICFKLYKSSDDFLYRVTYFKNRINLEVSHIISDGRGSIEFLKILVSNYIKIKYNLDLEITHDTTYISSSEDSYIKYYKKTKTTSIKKVKNYVYLNKKLKNKTRYLECHMSTKKVLECAHKYNATLTTYLVSVLIYSLKNELSLSDYNKQIKIDIPVDLRKYFKSTSKKNFFGLTSVTYKFTNIDERFEDIIKSVNKQFKKNVTVNKLSERVNKMVAFEKNIFCRVVPIPIKNLVLKMINYFTQNMSTTCLSNIGRVTFEKEIEEYIKEVNVFTSTNNFQFTLCSFKDDLSIGISSRYKYNDIITNFCRHLRNCDIEILINTNEVD